MKKSAGILLYRFVEKHIEVFLVHPGGPFWKNKDAGAWSIPKGEFSEGEDPLSAAKREFEEETGIKCDGNFISLHPVKQRSSKIVYAWALEKDLDPAKIRSNLFPLEWPPRSGKFVDFPEIDKGQWFTPSQARFKINGYQEPFIAELLEKIMQGLT